MSDPHADAERIAHALGRAIRHGKGWRCLCPAHVDKEPSLDIDVASSGRILFTCRAGCEPAAVLAELKRRALWPPPDAASKRAPPAAPPPAVPASRSTIRDSLKHPTWGEPTSVFRYSDAVGDIRGVVCRWDKPPGSRRDKEILPAVPAPGGRWRCWQAMPDPRPLYRLAALIEDPDDQVLVVEGERKADDAAGVLAGVVVVSWAGGASAASKTDWAPLAGRRVVLWPDNDDPGEAAMRKLAAILAPIATQVRVIRRDPDQPFGWDVGDAVRGEGWDEDRLIEYARNRAELYEAEGAPETPTRYSPDIIISGDSARGPQKSAEIVQLRPVAQARPAPSASHLPDSDIMLAAEFARQHADGLRYVNTWGQWLRWTGAVWQPERTLLAFDLSRAICLQMAAAIEKGGKAVASAKTVAAVVTLARSDRRIAVTEDVWDADKWLLNTPGGTINLRTGELKSHLQSDHITKMTGVAPDDGMPTPHWDEFLRVITCDDVDLQAFLRRLAGYSLTGDTREHALFFFYGTGGNGKGTLINAMTGCMGDYARTAPIETFIETKGERHPTELAMLRGARFVSAQETEEGRRWAESRIKALTGGDKIAARFMRQDFFEFLPEFKLVIAGNNKPGLRTVDEAIRRRLHLVPFAANIAPSDRDHDLADKLKAEWPGILSWMISGCVEWQEMGLRPPACVTNATADYLTGEDAIAAWVADKCEVGPNLSDHRSALYASYKKWCEANGEFCPSNKRFIEKMQTHGYDKKDTNTSRLFTGLRVTAEMADYSQSDRR